VTISILLVDDHTLLRQGLRWAFEQTDDLQVVAEASTLADARALERSHRPDVAVVDVHLGDGNGLAFVSDLRKVCPEMGLVVLTMSDDDAHLFAARDAGASAFVLKSAPTDDVIAAVREAQRAPTSFTAANLAAADRRGAKHRSVQLTPREAEVLQLLAQGAPTAAVAEALQISQSTVKTHVARVYDKLGAKNRTQALMAAHRLRLVQPNL
jgi:DNA-binding NarL/FixJ family response regulator